MYRVALDACYDRGIPFLATFFLRMTGLLNMKSSEASHLFLHEILVVYLGHGKLFFCRGSSFFFFFRICFWKRS